MHWFTPVVAWLSEPGPQGPVLFVILYIVAAVTLVPAFILTFAAGAIFGVWRGTLLVFLGATLGAIAAYGVSFRLSRLRAMAWLDRDPRVAAVRRAVAGEGVWVQFLLRLSPIVPYNLLNYALGLSRVRFRDFLAASPGMLPAIILYTYYGRVAGDVARLAVGAEPPRDALYYVMLIVGLVATVLATTFVARAARRAMEERGEGISTRRSS